mmetsp:Transcript_93862/g.265164  ORF Transcript_93862/g.265164 Transcript_93862/m.265164 type:complete len:208 (-) Transcript_93862:7-630(-)
MPINPPGRLDASGPTVTIKLPASMPTRFFSAAKFSDSSRIPCDTTNSLKPVRPSSLEDNSSRVFRAESLNNSRVSSTRGGLSTSPDAPTTSGTLAPRPTISPCHRVPLRDQDCDENLLSSTPPRWLKNGDFGGPGNQGAVIASERGDGKAHLMTQETSMTANTRNEKGPCGWVAAFRRQPVRTAASGREPTMACRAYSASNCQLSEA